MELKLRPMRREQHLMVLVSLRGTEDGVSTSVGKLDPIVAMGRNHHCPESF